MIALVILGFACIGGAMLMLVSHISAPALERRVSLQRAATTPGRAPTTARAGFRERVGRPVVQAALRAANRLGAGAAGAHTEGKLRSAGLDARLTPEAFATLRVAAAVVGIGAGALLGLALHSSGRGLVLAIALGIAGFYVPQFALTRRATQRASAIVVALPSALDLLAVSIEAGQGFDAAVLHLIERLRGPLADELRLVESEIRVGVDRARALRNFADRVDSPDVRTFVEAVIHSDTLGLSLGRILHLQADDLRNRRQNEIEEQAQKAPVKMLLPTVLFIFPVMFVVVLWPALAKIHNVL